MMIRNRSGRFCGCFLLFFVCGAVPVQASEPVNDIAAPGLFLLKKNGLFGDRNNREQLIQFHTTMKLEGESWQNRVLRKGKKQENRHEFEPQFRLRMEIARKSSLYGVVEAELKNKTRWDSGKPEENKTQLELTQGYIGGRLRSDGAEIRAGRWLYRDAREWLFDENIDGIWGRWKKDDWQVEMLAGRVNYWQRDLLDDTTRNKTVTSVQSTLLQYSVEQVWDTGVYFTANKNTHDVYERQYFYGIRSHRTPDTGWRHWLEIGGMSAEKSGKKYQGGVVDAGFTWIQDGPLRPRFTLGYAMADKEYHQTGLQSNEACFGGNTKFSIYGNTLSPELTNIRILTVGTGMDITRRSSLDLVYHHYRQSGRESLSSHDPALKSRYDNRSTLELGSEIDLIWGYEFNNNIKTELLLGMFMPSGRFRTSSAGNAPRSSPAYSAGLEVEIKF
jgi:alginate production protein